MYLKVNNLAHPSSWILSLESSQRQVLVTSSSDVRLLPALFLKASQTWTAIFMYSIAQMIGRQTSQWSQRFWGYLFSSLHMTMAITMRVSGLLVCSPMTCVIAWHYNESWYSNSKEHILVIDLRSSKLSSPAANAMVPQLIPSAKSCFCLLSSTFDPHDVSAWFCLHTVASSAFTINNQRSQPLDCDLCSGSPMTAMVLVLYRDQKSW